MFGRWYGGSAEPCRSPRNSITAAPSRSRCRSTGTQAGTPAMTNPVTIIMVEDDEGHARLIERNIRRSGVNNEIKPFTDGTSAVNYLFGKDGTGSDRKGQALLVLLDLNLPDMTGRLRSSNTSSACPLRSLPVPSLPNR